MNSSILRRLTRALTTPYLAHPPAIWGKLPTQGDYVHHRVDLAQRQAWFQWVQKVWSPAMVVKKPSLRPRTAPSTANWMQLDVHPSHGAAQQLPIAFVLPSSDNPLFSDGLLQGVMVVSSDKVGRTCPLIIYQLVQPRWISRQWLQEHHAIRQTHQFWWGRLVWLAAQGLIDWSQLLTAVDAVWRAHEPGLRHCFGGAAPVASPQAMAQIIGPIPDDDPALDVQGVQHLPWSDWPHSVLRKTRPSAGYWRQDAEGAYVQAERRLDDLWKHP